jgi:hypothetical protein
VELTATATDDGEIQSVVFRANGLTVGTGTLIGDNLYSYTWIPDTLGSYIITATAIDDAGHATTATAASPVLVVSPATDVSGKTLHNGLQGELYLNEWQWLDVLPDFSKLKPVAISETADFSHLAVLPGQTRLDAYGIRYRAYVMVENSGLYEFTTTSDDGSLLRIDGMIIVANDGLHAVETRSGSIWLAAGAHPIELDYAEWYGDQVLALTATTTTEGSITWLTTPLPVSSMPTGVQPGLLGHLYPGDGNLMTGVPDFAQMTENSQEIVTDVTNLGTLPSQILTDDYALLYTGYVDIAQTGVHSFTTTSDDGSILWIDGMKVVSNDGLHAASSSTGDIWLEAGAHSIELGFFEWYGDSILSVSGVDESGAPVTWWTESSATTTIPAAAQ